MYCPRCSQEKLEDMFYIDSRRKEGRRKTCKACDWEFRDKDKNRTKSARAWHAMSPDRRKEKAAARKIWTANNKDKIRNADLKRKYGITLTQYKEILLNQDGECAICESTDPRGHGDFHVDHCHSTGAVRGLLCSDCNLAIGLLKDSPKLVRYALNYLERDRNGKPSKNDSRAA
jgi:hypothetical protein